MTDALTSFDGIWVPGLRCEAGRIIIELGPGLHYRGLHGGQPVPHHITPADQLPVDEQRHHQGCSRALSPAVLTRNLHFA